MDKILEKWGADNDCDIQGRGEVNPISSFRIERN